ncbi:hypothetical protein H6G91_26200 [Nostoc muscorum FACHB-395]|nr:hypothetical protein [Desmonostoc muscorum FACHB-395]
MTYNPWHERLGGWFCSSLCNLSDRQINVIISQFGFGMDIEGLDKELPSVYMECFDKTVDTSDMYAFA